MGEVEATAALTLALAHLLFNVFGGLIIYGIRPLRGIPIRLAEVSGDLVVEHPHGKKLLIGGYVVGSSYVLPICYLILSQVL